MRINVSSEELSNLLLDGTATGAVVEFDRSQYLRDKIANVLDATNSYDPEIATAARGELPLWMILLDMVKVGGAVDIASIETDITAKLKKSFKDDFDALADRLGKLEKDDGISKRLEALEKDNAIEKRVEALEKSDTVAAIEKRLAALEKPAKA